VETSSYTALPLLDLTQSLLDKKSFSFVCWLKTIISNFLTPELPERGIIIEKKYFNPRT
jgi:hypothetical protein